MNKLQRFLTSLLIIFLPIIVNGQVISGKVTDKTDGNPIIGATISIKGTPIGTVADMNGEYKLKVDSLSQTLIVSFIGYTTQEITINDRILINIELELQINELEEVVAIGYGTCKKSCITGAISGVRIRGASSTSSAESVSYSSGNDNSFTAGQLTAGEINDFSKWELWNDKSQSELRTYQKDWHISPSERYTVIIKNEDDIPMIGEVVHLMNENEKTVWTATTDNTGRAELWTNMFPQQQNGKTFSITVNTNGEMYRIKRAKPFKKGVNHISVSKACNLQNTVDAVFVVDATGSMSDEINYLKEELNDVIKRVQNENSKLSLNLGSVFYRDHGDAYLTQKSELSNDISQTINFIQNQCAGGGGDTPEAVDEALEVAINELAWSEKALAKIIFLVLDAPPHSAPENIKRLEEVSLKAAQKGIKIVPITASGIDKSGEYLMRSLALATNGTYVFLTDDSGIGNSHIKPTTDNYDVEKLNDLLVRLFYQYTSSVSCDKVVKYDEGEISDTTLIKSRILPELKPSLKNDENKIPDSKQYQCKFYPNPTNGILHIDMEGDIKELFVRDISGKLLERIKINGQHKKQINISHFPRGIYLMTYFGDNDKPISARIILNQ